MGLICLVKIVLIMLVTSGGLLVVLVGVLCGGDLVIRFGVWSF